MTLKSSVQSINAAVPQPAQDVNGDFSLGGGGNIEAAQVVSAWMKNPGFWSSFMQEAGNSFREAKSWAKDDGQAAVYALTVGLINGGIEVGLDGASGIQGLERSVREGNTSALRDFLRSSAGEGLEEVEQGLVSRGVAQLMGSGAPVFSTEDPDAVINPGEMLKEGAMGAAVGGLLSGGVLAGNTLAARVQGGPSRPHRRPQRAGRPRRAGIPPRGRKRHSGALGRRQGAIRT